MVLGMFAAGAAVALLALRLLLGVINYISSRRRSNASTVIVLGSGECWFGCRSAHRQRWASCKAGLGHCCR